MVALQSPWLTSTLTIYDCRRRATCVTCVSDDLPCVWCPQSHSCENRRDDCAVGTAINSVTAPDRRSSDLDGVSFCPKIEAEQRMGAYLTPAGHEITVALVSRNLLVSCHLALRSTDYKCL